MISLKSDNVFGNHSIKKKCNGNSDYIRVSCSVPLYFLLWMAMIYAIDKAIKSIYKTLMLTNNSTIQANFITIQFICTHHTPEFPPPPALPKLYSAFSSHYRRFIFIIEYTTLSYDITV